ncbi:MAG TPA: phospholipase D-like domain-containing protein [Candidatus Saccharimonadales bacterium]|nr:phospholipase D-like domain-containing protein [Candidatus Saccharimonadales bacterium]
MKLTIFGAKNSPTDLLGSRLLNEETFYPAFLKDLKRCKSEVIIECPFVTTRRLNQLLPVLEKLKARKVRVVINTRDPQTNDDEYRRSNSHDALSTLQHLGVHVLYTRNHHRKLVIIDRSILYEGSLNVLSQNNSAEVMRRVESTQLAWEMIRFVGFDRVV